MNLYRIEYSIKSNGQRIICHSVGENKDDVIQDIMSVVGEITILDMSFICDIHRISGSIKKQIIYDSSETQTRSRIGRPRKYEIGE